MARLIDNELNLEIRGWTKTTAAIAKQKMKDFGIGKTYLGSKSNGIESFNGRVKSDQFGDANNIAFGMKKHMVFVHKGVGRGYPITKTFTAAQSERFSALGKHVRYEKPFLNPVLDERVPKLADIISNKIADASVRSFEIK